MSYLAHFPETLQIKIAFAQMLQVSMESLLRRQYNV